MKIYVVTTKDRHFDIEIELFKDKEKALNYARNIAIENHNEQDTPIEQEEVKGWLLCLNYSSDGDYVRVEEKEVL